RGPYSGDILGSYCNLKGNFHNVWGPWCPANGGWPQIPCSRNPLTEQYIYKRRSDGIYIINLNRTWEKLLLAAGAVVAVKNSAHVSVISSRNTGHFLLPLEPLLLLATWLLESLLSRSRQPSRSRDFWWLVIQGLATSLSQRCLMLTCLPSLCVRLSSVLRGHCHPVQQQGSLLGGSDVVGAGPGRSAHAWHHLLRNFRVNGALQLPNLLLLNLRSQAGLNACGCLLSLFSSSLLKTGALSLPLRADLQLPLLRPLTGRNNH
ncbi:hypothetical protein HPG69_007748, partial [Diceros bicornis minor]